MRIFCTHKLKIVVSIFLFLAAFQFFTSQAIAQLVEDNTVTATVPDIIPPSAPFLISPEDEALVNDSTPAFVWQQSTDNVGVSYYELYIDGALKFGSIPTSSTSNSQYTLTYNSGSGQYMLVPVNPIASDGHHTWHVMVYDAAGNSNTSVVWDFYIDTLAPAFVIESIGPLTTNISASDISSVPDDPIELEDNEPLFTGSGEADSTVQVTVQIPDQSNQVINFTISSSGTWSFQLGILPRDEIITLDFVITDTAGNISVLTDLKILIILDVIIIPPPSSTPTPGVTPTPSPGTTPPPGVTPTPEITPTPGVSPAPTPVSTPLLVIPILPPKEIAVLVQRIILDLIPEQVLEIISAFPQAIREAIARATQALAPTGVLVATVAIPVIGFLALLMQFSQNFSWDIILKILQALGLLPPKKPQGMVFDSQTSHPVAFALLTITSTESAGGEKIIETAVTDVDGIYQGIHLPVGKYVITVNHQDYTFPTKKDRPRYFSIDEFYRGEEFEVKSARSLQLFLIPMDKKTGEIYKYTLGKTFRNIVRKFTFTDLFWPLFIISLMICTFYPTWINLIVLAFYLVMLIKRIIHSLEKPAISGYVTTPEKEPIQNAIIRVSDPSKGELVSIVNTNKEGYHKSYLDPNKYQIQVTKHGLIWDRQGQMSLEEIDVTKERKTLDATMRKVSDIYKELFGDIEL